MKNYIRRVRVNGLFDQENELVVDFEQSVNCIYGINGTGKTELINLIVNVLRVNKSGLINACFSSVTLLTSADGKKQPETLVTVSKIQNQVYYTFNNDYTLDIKSDFRNRKTKIHKGINYYLDSKNVFNNLDTDTEQRAISKQILIKILSEHISLTYVPLLRYSYQPAYIENNQFQIKYLRNSIRIENELEEQFDPNTIVIEEIQDEFSKRYASAQSTISKKLESLSSIIFQKLLLEEDLNKGPLKESAYINQLLNSGKIEDEVNVDSVISQIKDLNLNIKENLIREHYSQWNEIQIGLLKAHNKYTEVIESGVDTKERQEAFNEYSQAYYKLLSSRKLYNKLESAIEEIKSVYLKKQAALSPFNTFKEEINRFLNGNKKFDFTDSGEFIFTNNDRPLNISKLSSGEKHLIAILGRVSFSASNMSTFIADEPELSLHLQWQREIIPSIRRLSPNTQVIVATHSPAIISKDAKLIDIEECYRNA
ncbi:AAA family ATPase [Shewanella algae]|uniref:AAA family ATPase n=1 Tax=Shewanella algae TaxID=38313 RepID=UPI003B684C88